MDQTGSNVYKGLVGLYPIYDPKDGMDMGDERRGCGCPASATTTRTELRRRLRHPAGVLRLPLRRRRDDPQGHPRQLGEFPAAKNPRTHPEWWGKTFYRHFPNHGFVGDVFTVNGTAYPVLEVKRRKYRFRFLDASIARIYDFKLMSSTQGPKTARSLGYTGEDLDGQWRIPDGQQCMKFTQIASDGGLLPFPITRDNFELWPAKRREVIIDFTKYQDGAPTTKGDVVYLTNMMKMPDGRMWSNSSRFSPDPNYKVPVLKFVIGDDAPDDSVIPTAMRPLPPLPTNWKSLMANRLIFEVKRGGMGGETEWLINGKPFDPATCPQPEEPGRQDAARPAEARQLQPLGDPQRRRRLGAPLPPPHGGAPHRDAQRQGRRPAADAGHPDDMSREDLVALDPSESVIIYRGFRDFVGPYVAHCHNLAHEDHAMMFGWEITP